MSKSMEICSVCGQKMEVKGHTTHYYECTKKCELTKEAIHIWNVCKKSCVDCADCEIDGNNCFVDSDKIEDPNSPHVPIGYTKKRYIKEYIREKE